MNEDKPTNLLAEGASVLAQVLVPHGFEFRIVGAGKGSGGHFAAGEFRRGDRKLELHFRFTLGLVRYHLGQVNVSHGHYMSELGVIDQCEYPDFPDAPLDSFPRLAHDLRFANDFLTGSGDVLRRASAIEAAEEADHRLKLRDGYTGETRTREKLRSSFRLRNYAEVLRLAAKVRYPDRLLESERKMISLAQKRLGR